jgi:hypothetical protein
MDAARSVVEYLENTECDLFNKRYGENTDAEKDESEEEVAGTCVP